MKKLLIILLLTGCATTRQTSYVQAPIELAKEPIELAISMVIITLVIIIGLSTRQH